MKTRSEYDLRRNHLAKTYSRSLFVIPSGDEAKRSHSINYRFKVASDFFYLTGLQLSKSVLVLVSGKTYLFIEQNQDHLWGEFTALSDQDQRLLENIQIESLSRLEEVLKSHLQDVERLCVSLERIPWLDSLMLSLVAFQRRGGGRRAETLQLVDSRTLLGTLRIVKDESEIQNLRKASELSSMVHKKLLSRIFIGKTEKEICNWIEGECLQQNMDWMSYETIVGSGERATILHARASQKQIQNNELILVDAGAEWKGYCADITRVIPSGKKFTTEQKQIYSLVLAVQKDTLKEARPGISLDELHKNTLQNLRERLSTLMGAQDVTQEQVKELFPHSTSHWIGLDVHDPCPYVDDQGNPILLKAGMSFTVEPGLYFRSKKTFSKYFGIGVRIEDDVIITSNGAEVLTSAPKEVEEMEELRAKAIP